MSISPKFSLVHWKGSTQDPQNNQDKQTFVDIPARLVAAKLPVEVFDRIVSYSDWKSLLDLSRTNRNLHELAARRIYEVIEYDVKDPQDFHSDLITPSTALSGQVSPPSRGLRHPYDYTQTLVMRHHNLEDHFHSHEHKSTQVQLPKDLFPNLKILHIVLEGDCYHYRFCWQTPLPLEMRIAYNLSHPPNLPCTLLSGIKPKTIILSGMKDGTNPNSIDPPSIREVFENCSKLIYRLDMSMINPAFHSKLLPPKAKTIIYVFSSPSPTYRAISEESKGIVNKEKKYPEKRSPYPYLPSFASTIADLAIWITKNNLKLWMVNAGSINPNWLGIEEVEYEDIQARLKMEIEKRIQKRRLKALESSEGEVVDDVEEGIRWMGLEDLRREGLYHSVFYDCL